MVLFCNLRFSCIVTLFESFFIVFLSLKVEVKKFEHNNDYSRCDVTFDDFQIIVIDMRCVDSAFRSTDDLRVNLTYLTLRGWQSLSVYTIYNL